MHPVYGTPAWKFLRSACLRRDGFRCQIQLPGCKGRAAQADHIVELGEGGAPFDLSNLQAACSHCNVAKRNNRIRRVGVRSW